MGSITKIPPATIPLLSLIEDYKEAANKATSATTYSIYMMVVKDLEDILKHIKDKQW